MYRLLTSSYYSAKSFIHRDKLTYTCSDGNTLEHMFSTKRVINFGLHLLLLIIYSLMSIIYSCNMSNFINWRKRCL